MKPTANTDPEARQPTIGPVHPSEFLAPSPRKRNYVERASILEALLDLRPHTRPGQILDVGCGTKPYESLFSGVGDRYVGLDYPVTMMASKKAATRADVFADCLRLPFTEESFETVVCTQVLEHVADPARCVAEIARVLKPGGVVLLSAPMTWPLHEEPHDFFRYTIHGLRHLVRRAELELIAEWQRGRVMGTLGQLFLDAHLGRFAGNSLPVRIYGNILCLLVNSVSVLLDRLCPNPRLCLGWAVVARKHVREGST